MSLKFIEGPTQEPVTLDQAKAQTRVEHAEDDAWFSDIAIPSARKTAEHITGRALAPQTWEQVLDGFPALGICLGKPPVDSVVSVKYIDADGAEQTIAPGDYRLDNDASPGYVFPVNSWPSAIYGRSNAVRVRFITGYPTPGEVPANVRHWMLIQIATAYEQREGFALGISVSAIPNRFVEGLLDEAKEYL